MSMGLESILQSTPTGDDIALEMGDIKLQYNAALDDLKVVSASFESYMNACERYLALCDCVEANEGMLEPAVRDFVNRNGELAMALGIDLAMEDDSQDAQKENGEKVTEKKQGFFRRMWEGIKAFIKKILDGIGNFFHWLGSFFSPMKKDQAFIEQNKDKLQQQSQAKESFDENTKWTPDVFMGMFNTVKTIFEKIQENDVIKESGMDEHFQFKDLPDSIPFERDNKTGLMVYQHKPILAPEKFEDQDFFTKDAWINPEAIETLIPFLNDYEAMMGNFNKAIEHGKQNIADIDSGKVSDKDAPFIKIAYKNYIVMVAYMADLLKLYRSWQKEIKSHILQNIGKMGNRIKDQDPQNAKPTEPPQYEYA